MSYKEVIQSFELKLKQKQSVRIPKDGFICSVLTTGRGDSISIIVKSLSINKYTEYRDAAILMYKEGEEFETTSLSYLETVIGNFGIYILFEDRKQ